METSLWKVEISLSSKTIRNTSVSLKQSCNGVAIIGVSTS